MDGSRPHPNINQWVYLHKDLLLRIMKYLDLKTDLPRVRGVCSSWRSALPLTEFPMCKSHVQVPSLGEGDKAPLFLHESVFYFFCPLPSPANGSANSSDHIGSCCWIARMVETGTNKRHLINPLANHHLDFINTDPSIIGEINLLDCRILELARNLSLVRELVSNAKPVAKKVVGEWDLTSSDHFVVLVQLDKEDGGGLLMLKSRDREWVKIDETSENDQIQSTIYSVHDIAFHNGKFYFLQKYFDTWRVGTINPGDCSKSFQFKRGFCSIFGDGIHLVPSRSNDCLYLLFNENKYRSHLYRPYKVFQIKEEHKRYGSRWWKPVENFGDKILFIGNYVSFELHNSALKQIPQWKSISMCKFSTCNFGINFLVHSFDFPEDAELKQRKCWSYNKFPEYYAMKKDLMPLSLDKTSIAMEVYNRLFFPPPSWVKWRCPGFDNVEVKFDDIIFPVESDYDDDDDYGYNYGGLTESDRDDDAFDYDEL